MKDGKESQIMEISNEEARFDRISATLKKRFCKDFAVPITVFEEPYFSQRMRIVEMTKPVMEDWLAFAEETTAFRNEQEYFELYGKVKEAAIESIRGKKAYEAFNGETFPEPALKTPKGNLYAVPNDGKRFISVDMRKANFSVLRHYDPSIFDGAETWEDWISGFTDMRHLKRSKYVRQVIMGACNPGRQIKYERLLTEKTALGIMERTGLQPEYLAADEIVFKAPDGVSETENAVACIRTLIGESETPFFRTEAFRLESLPDGKGFVKADLEGGRDAYKCVPAEDFHATVKRRLGLPMTEDDLVFEHNGRLAKYLSF